MTLQEKINIIKKHRVNPIIQKRKIVEKMLGELIEAYNSMSLEVDPKHYWTTGVHHSTLLKIKHEIGEFTQISPEMKEKVELFEKNRK